MTLHEEVDASGGGGRWVGPACHVPDIVHSTVSFLLTQPPPPPRLLLLLLLQRSLVLCTYVRMCVCTYVRMYVCTYVRNCLTQKINFIMEHYGAASTQCN